jgi:cytochrome P450
MGHTLNPPVEFDPMSSTYFNDPYEVYRQLRDSAPVYWNDHYGFYALSRFDDVSRAHRDLPALSSTYHIEFLTLMARQQIPEGSRNLILMDPPEHDRMRALVSRVFTPRAVQNLEDVVRDVVCGLLDDLVGTESFDYVADFSALFPIEVISTMLGVPPADRQMIRETADIALHREEGQVALSAENAEAFAKNFMYFLQLAQERRARPQDDMITGLTQAVVERTDGTTSMLTDEEIGKFAVLLSAAGAETVTKLVGNAAVLFDEHRDAWRTVCSDPSQIPGAVEEVLRFYPPSQYQGRFAIEDTQYHGVTIEAGTPVLLLTGAATRDERRFEDPDVFDITRKPTMSLAFGYGIHVCLGASLARLESRIAIEETMRRFPDFEVDRSGLRRVQMSNVAGYSNVPFVGRSRPAAS